MAENEEQKSLLIKVKEENERVGLKLIIQKTKIMPFGPITSWQIDGEKVETVADFIFFGSKITADSDCSHKIKRHLILGSDRPIKKQRHHFTANSPYSQSYGFSSRHVQM